MRTTLDLPDPLFRELKVRAAQEGVKMKALLATYIEEGMRGVKGVRPQPSPARSPLPIARRATGVTIPGFNNSRIAEILDAEDANVGH